MNWSGTPRFKRSSGRTTRPRDCCGNVTIVSLMPPLNPVRKRVFWLLFWWFPAGAFGLSALAMATSHWLLLLAFLHAFAIDRALMRIRCPHCDQRLFNDRQTAGQQWDLTLARESCPLCGKVFSESPGDARDSSREDVGK